jgi:hypothetical protein
MNNRTEAHKQAIKIAQTLVYVTENQVSLVSPDALEYQGRVTAEKNARILLAVLTTIS